MRKTVTALCLAAAALVSPLGPGEAELRASEEKCKPVVVFCEEFDLGWYRLAVCIKANVTIC